jgi:hypothetical protein
LRSQCNILRPLPAIAPDQYVVEADGDELPCELGARATRVVHSSTPKIRNGIFCGRVDPCGSVDAHRCCLRYSSAVLPTRLLQQAGLRVPQPLAHDTSQRYPLQHIIEALDATLIEAIVHLFQVTCASF